MLGSRGIWCDGWKAVALGTPGRGLSEDDWELYHLDVDPTEQHDLAAAEPARLREMVQRWWTEAGRVGALPVGLLPWGGNPLQRRRTHFEVLPGTGHLPTAVAPDIRNRSYAITAWVTVPEGGCEGVLVAHGDACGGYALYVRDGRLVHDHNFVGTHTVLAADPVLAAGDHADRAALLADGRPHGRGDARASTTRRWRRAPWPTPSAR